MSASLLIPSLIVGLGNPDRKYQNNRHNVGFMVLDKLCYKFGGQWSGRGKIKAQSSSIHVNARKVTLLKPETYMNLSGKSVLQVMEKLYIDPEDILVVHDDLDLDFGVIRIKIGGGEGGHRGLRSISDSLRSRVYVRLRIGIGRPPEGEDPAYYVLRNFNGDQISALDEILELSCQAIEEILNNGVITAQNRYNSMKVTNN